MIDKHFSFVLILQYWIQAKEEKEKKKIFCNLLRSTRVYHLTLHNVNTTKSSCEENILALKHFEIKIQIMIEKFLSMSSLNRQAYHAYT